MEIPTSTPIAGPQQGHQASNYNIHVDLAQIRASSMIATSGFVTPYEPCSIDSVGHVLAVLLVVILYFILCVLVLYSLNKQNIYIVIFLVFFCLSLSIYFSHVSTDCTLDLQT